MSSAGILYFPSIEFTSDEWVKSSLLIWDKIYRIVPKGYSPFDSYAVKQAQNNGFIEDIILEERDVTLTGDKFLKFCENIPFTPVGLDVDEYDRLHIDKIDKRLFPYLDEIYKKIGTQGFLKFSKPLARGYMFHLSKVVAERRNLTRGTDNTDSWTVSPYFVEEANFNEFVYDRTAGGFYSSLIVKDLIPSNLDQYSMTDVVSFAKDRADQKKEFRDLLNGFANELNTIDSKEFALQQVQSCKDRLQKAKNELSKSMEFSKEKQYSFFAMGVPVALTAYGGLIGAELDPFGINTIFGSFAIGAVAAFSNYSYLKSQKRGNHDISYLIEVEKAFARDNAYPNLPYRFDQFIND